MNRVYLEPPVVNFPRREDLREGGGAPAQPAPPPRSSSFLRLLLQVCTAPPAPPLPSGLPCASSSCSCTAALLAAPPADADAGGVQSVRCHQSALPTSAAGPAVGEGVHCSDGRRPLLPLPPPAAALSPALPPSSSRRSCRRRCRRRGRRLGRRRPRRRRCMSPSPSPDIRRREKFTTKVFKRFQPPG